MAVAKINKPESFENAGVSALTITNANGNAAIFRYGRLRIIKGYIKPNNTGTGIVWTTLSAGDRPQVVVQYPLTAYGMTSQAEGTVNTDGQVKMNAPQNNNWFHINVSYLVDI